MITFTYVLILVNNKMKSFKKFLEEEFEAKRITENTLIQIRSFLNSLSGKVMYRYN